MVSNQLNTKKLFVTYRIPRDDKWDKNIQHYIEGHLSGSIIWPLIRNKNIFSNCDGDYQEILKCMDKCIEI